MFSETENQVLKVILKLRTGRPIYIAKIAEEKYFKKKYDAKATVASAIRRINKKCVYHKLNWFINGAGIGRNGRLVWKDFQ